MTLWAKIVHQGSTGSQLVLSNFCSCCKALQTCTRGTSVNLSRQFKFNGVNKTTSSLFSSHLGPRFLSTSVDVNDGKVIDSTTTTTDEQTPVEWTGEPDEFILVLSDEEIQELSGGDPEVIKKIRYIQLEHEIYRQNGYMVPLNPISISRWTELILLVSKSKRLKFHEFLFKIEKWRENDKTKALLKRARRREELGTDPQLDEDPDGMIYGMGRNTLFVRLRESKEIEFEYSRIMREKMFGQPFVLDCDYDRYMTMQEARNCAQQLGYILSRNRMHHRPFDLVMCNANRDDFTLKSLHKMVTPLYDPAFPIDVMDKSYLDLYPKDRLVYLTSDATEELENFDEDKIYILGCHVAKTDPRPLSKAKAKKERIRTKKLPLDRYLHWGTGYKGLTLNQIVAIMLDQRLYNDWTKSLLHVPRRKLYGYEGRKEYKDMPFEDANEEGTTNIRGFGRNAIVGERFQKGD